MNTSQYHDHNDTTEVFKHYKMKLEHLSQIKEEDAKLEKQNELANFKWKKNKAIKIIIRLQEQNKLYKQLQLKIKQKILPQLDEFENLLQQVKDLDESMYEKYVKIAKNRLGDLFNEAYMGKYDPHYTSYIEKEKARIETFKCDESERKIYKRELEDSLKTGFLNDFCDYSIKNHYIEDVYFKKGEGVIFKNGVFPESRLPFDFTDRDHDFIISDMEDYIKERISTDSSDINVPPKNWEEKLKNIINRFESVYSETTTKNKIMKHIISNFDEEYMKEPKEILGYIIDKLYEKNGYGKRIDTKGYEKEIEENDIDSDEEYDERDDI